MLYVPSHFILKAKYSHCQNSCTSFTADTLLAEVGLSESRDRSSSVCCDRTSQNAFNLKAERFRLDIESFVFFSVRVVKHCNRLLREVADAPSLGTFKVRLDWTL